MYLAEQKPLTYLRASKGREKSQVFSKDRRASSMEFDSFNFIDLHVLVPSHSVTLLPNHSPNFGKGELPQESNPLWNSISLII